MTDGGIILICIPTCMRPKMLAACLESISQTRLPKDYETRLLVLDNDAAESAREVFETMSFPFAARYTVEPKRGLSTIRNRAFDEAKKEQATCMAFVDDDQTLDKEWLIALLEGMTETGADAVSGCAEEVYVGKPPWWIRPGKDSPNMGIESAKSMVTNLVLIHVRLFSQLNFDERFNLTGAEDYDFSLRAVRLGFVFARTGRSKAWAPVVAVRMTFRSHALSQWQRQTGYVLSHRTADGFWKSLLFIPKGLMKVIKGLLYCACAILFGKKMLMRGTKNLIAGTGLIYGVFAHGGYTKYAVIEGE